MNHRSACKIIFFLTLFSMFPDRFHARTIRVPADQPTIQAAVTEALNGDTILLADGIFSGEGNRDIQINGNDLVIRSENGPDLCMIDVQGTFSEPHRAFLFTGGTTRATEIRGLRFIGGYMYEGGAILCEYGSPSILECQFISNSAFQFNPRGGAIMCRNASPLIGQCEFEGNFVIGRTSVGGAISCHEGSNPTIDRCTFTNNSSEGCGGAFHCTDSSATILNSVFDGNSCYDTGLDGSGGGIYCIGSAVVMSNCLFTNNFATDYGASAMINGSTSITILNCTFADNTCGTSGGALYVNSNVSCTISNCILWNNWPDSIRIVEPTIIDVTYSDIDQEYAGEGNFSAYPIFAIGLHGDYYLAQTMSGQSSTSPCVDAGYGAASETCYPPELPEVCLNQFTTRSDGVSDGNAADLGFHYPCHFSSPTQTPTVATPTAAPATPAPLPTSTPLLSVRIEMPLFVSPGDPFEVIGSTVNTLVPMQDVPLFFILCIHDEYWFWPGWSHSEPDYRIVDVPLGEMRYEVVQPCIWPDTADDTVTHIWFFGALLNSEMTQILGQYAEVQWGFGPAR